MSHFVFKIKKNPKRTSDSDSSNFFGKIYHQGFITVPIGL